MGDFRHFAKAGNNEVIVLGFNKADGTVLYADPSALPGEDQLEIRKIAMSPSGQQADYLVSVLQTTMHKSGADWFSYLTSRRGGSNPGLVKFPLKEIQDLHPDQKALFGGYGKTSAEREAEAAAEPPAAVVVDAPTLTEQPLQSSAMSPTLEASLSQMAMAMASLAETQKAIVENMAPAKKPSRRTNKKAA